MKNFNTNTENNDEWLTPPELLKVLGPFDLDPCAPVTRPWPTASTHYTVQDNGLTQPWKGRVWLNPPYGRETYKWVARLAEHGSGLALIAPMLIDDLHALSDGLPHPPDPGMLRETAREVVANDYLVSTTMPDSYAAVEEISNAK